MQLIQSVRASSRAKVRGVSLIEVLVSILLASIGLLALAGSNVAAIRYSKLSQYRATAAALALDLGERMRANKTGLAGYTYASTDFGGQSGVVGTDQTCYGYAVPACSDVALAAFDLQNWRFLVRSQLPEGSAFIDIKAGQSAADVWVAWRDPAVANPNENSAEAQNLAIECPDGLGVGSDKSIRCSFFRINL